MEECRCSIIAPEVDSLFVTTGFLGGKRRRKKNKKNNKGGLSEVLWLTVGLVVGHQSIRTRVLVISRLVMLTPGLLIPELQTHRLELVSYHSSHYSLHQHYYQGNGHTNTTMNEGRAD